MVPSNSSNALNLRHIRALKGPPVQTTTLSKRSTVGNWAWVAMPSSQWSLLASGGFLHGRVEPEVRLELEVTRVADEVLGEPGRRLGIPAHLWHVSRQGWDSSRLRSSQGFYRRGRESRCSIPFPC